ncbi:PREDICTED: uncharacterized protein C6orf223 homolog [Condylura cristata]|uniref:uncharacterized protein C6orf223 homolog n=1 Tax=Condylura cristata TaxID=143302 RepID=UPI0006430258|nr:PREDICTED: uncharacterized protein C6orf223 homolog [Condylura cristata]
MMPLEETRALTQGGGPAGTGWALRRLRWQWPKDKGLVRSEGVHGGLFPPEDTPTQAAYLAIST